MPIPTDVLQDLRALLEFEVQSGRRWSPLDPEAVREFLEATPAAQAPAVSAPAAQAPAVSAPVAPSPATSAPVGAPVSVEGFASIEAIAAAVRVCKACPLAATRTNAVPGVGNVNRPDILFVGEGPGADEDLAGEPFVGAAGQLLTKMIAAMGYRREEVFIANIVKCRPPRNRTPEPTEAAACLPFLERQIALLAPKVIVTLGATAYKGLFPDSAPSLSSVRGRWLDWRGVPVMPTFHPAYLLRVPAAKRAVWTDLQAVLKKLGRTAPSAGRSPS